MQTINMSIVKHTSTTVTAASVICFSLPVMIIACGCAHNKTLEEERFNKAEEVSAQIESWVPIGTSQAEALHIMEQHHFSCYLTNVDSLYFTPPVYQTWYFILYLKGSKVSACAREESKFPICERIISFGITNKWFVPATDFDTVPKWNEKGEPPLLVGKAISLAKAAIVSIGGNTDSFVTSVEFRPAAWGAPPTSNSEYSKYRSFWYYIIDFQEVSLVGSHTTCVVLMDGSVLWPELRYEPKQKSIQDYLD